jgi:aryl-alcohol dehydrogenase-like predicted oxidoreductase
MDTVRLGRTDLVVSVAGLGCGGHSRLGQARGATEAESIAVVHKALDLGITFFDTARAYGTEEIVGKALAGRRDEVVISSKSIVDRMDDSDYRLPAAELRASVDKSLSRLRTDHIDVFHLHGVRDRVYDHCCDVLVPELRALQDEGKIRHLAISESFITEPGHTMLERALTTDDIWDVVMVGFNLLNPSARHRVLATTRERDVGTLAMFAVRRALSQPEELRRVVEELVHDGHVDAVPDGDAPLGFLVHEGGAASVVEAAYRFVRHEPGMDVVLTGTGSTDHLEENVRAILAPPLPEQDLARLEQLFGRIDHLSGN